MPTTMLCGSPENSRSAQTIASSGLVMQMTKAFGRVLLDALADRLHHLEVDAEQVVAAHARLAGDAGGDDAHVRAGDVGIIGRALQLGVEIVDRPGLGDVERLALGNALGDVEQDDVAELAHRGEVGEGSADHSGADQRDLLPSHEAAFLTFPCCCCSAAASWGVAAVEERGARLARWPPRPQPRGMPSAKAVIS